MYLCDKYFESIFDKAALLKFSLVPSGDDLLLNRCILVVMRSLILQSIGRTLRCGKTDFLFSESHALHARNLFSVQPIGRFVGAKPRAPVNQSWRREDHPSV